ncbi:hematopoietic SH2 domain-containing protein isoform X3 [Triplophysa dalaica]|uniref:hematopoietic SH2 domain-containing protein isoform X3 n=1 Tax=Triplophysa dalaica TaxID=1582913 RepID=UPI0024DFEEE5|nr:hematopoietic SH2 domain-containing protein isoform X3 [Triplophysa dalaica]
MLMMEQIEAAMYQNMKITGRLTKKKIEKILGGEKDPTMDRGRREPIIKWFVDNQAALLLCDGRFPPWFQGFISRQEAEDQLRDMNVGCFLIRLSEKGIGYILSYKGHDRCRHFVINQTRTGMLVVSGDSATHNSLTELIDYFKTTPIQPFGEYLTSYTTDVDSVEEDSKQDLYDVVQSKPIIRLGVSVKALTSLWEQTSDGHQETSSVLPPKSSRKLTTSTSFDRDSHSQQDKKIPPLLKKTATLRNSLSTGYLGPNAFHDKQILFEPMTSSKGVDEKPHGIRKRDSMDTKGGNSQLKGPENILPISIETNPTPQGEYNEKSQSLAFNPCDPTSSSPPQLPPKTASCYSTLLLFKKTQTEADQSTLQPNPLYEGLCTKKYVQTESDYDNRTKTICKTLLFEDTFQAKPDQRDNDTYEHILEIHGNGTCEDIPASDNNTYASLEEIQLHTVKKNHKWWKFHPESKKK